MHVLLFTPDKVLPHEARYLYSVMAKNTYLSLLLLLDCHTCRRIAANWIEGKSHEAGEKLGSEEGRRGVRWGCEGQDEHNVKRG